MDKRSEIREGIARKLLVFYWGTRTDKMPLWEDVNEFEQEDLLEDSKQILSYLHSQGAVLKVERELPENPWVEDKMADYYTKLWRRHHYDGYNQAQQEVLKAGYKATEPLIEEMKK